MRKWLLIPVVVLVLAVGFPRPVGATAPTEFTATFNIVSATVTSDRFADGNELISSTYQNTMAGDIVGTGTGTQDTVAHADTSANLHGMFTCTCTVAGRSGTFVVKYAGTCPPLPGPCTGNESIGHGTGELATLHGQGTFEDIPTGGVLKSWKLHFDPS